MSNIADRLIKRFDEKKVFKFSTVDPFNEESSWLSTYSPSLDLRLKTLGLPTGIVEVRGDSQAGKTTFTLMLLKGAQEQYGENLVAVILSSERRDNKPYAIQVGINVDDITIVRVKFVEDVFNKINQIISDVEEMIASGEIKLQGKPRYVFIWDSLGQTIAQQEKNAMEKRATIRTTETKQAKEDETKSAAMGSAARALSIGLRATIALSDEVDMTLVIINRAYDNIGSVGKSSYGGDAITFYPNMRFELARIEGLKVGEEEWGQVTQIRTIKTDYDRPKQKFNVEIGYGFGWILNEEDLEIGFKAGLLKKFGQNGASYLNGKLQWKTRRELYGLYEQKHPLLKVLTKKLIKLAHEQVLAERASKVN